MRNHSPCCFIWAVHVEIKELFKRAGYEPKKKYDNEELEQFFHYWNFLEERESFVTEFMNEPLDVILYSKYYWYSKLKNKYVELYGFDAGMEQIQYKIIEEMEQRLDEVDWNGNQKIDCMDT